MVKLNWRGEGTGVEGVEERHLLAKDMMPPKPSVLLLETVEVGELARESDSASESLASLRLLGRSSFCALEHTVA